jgi:predicted HTH transcriptional regulator
VQATIGELPFEGQRLVVALIAEMDLALKPCRVTGTRRAYLRVGDDDYELSQLEEDAFVVARSRRRFDEDPVPDTGVADLDSDQVNAFLSNARAAVPTLRRFDDMKVLLVGSEAPLGAAFGCSFVFFVEVAESDGERVDAETAGLSIWAFALAR